MDDSSDFAPLVSFPDGSQSFVNGFEAGMLWQRMQSGEAVIENALPYRQENAIVLERMADAAGYEASIRDVEDGSHEWIEVDFTKLPPKKPDLRIVE